ncbi:MAG: P-loop NTPase, partial [Pseudomonadota bacterium]
MSAELREKVLNQLARVKGPDLKSDLVSLGLIENVLVSDAKAIFSIKVPAAKAKELEPLRTAAEKAVMEVDGIESVTAVLTAERKADQTAGAKKAPQNPKPQSNTQNGSAKKAGVPGIDSIIAVASGKGGVGKSTTAVNLAIALASHGMKTGILDADIYGPSMPRMLGLKEKPEGQGKALIPLEAFGVKVMSMGFLVEE